MSWNPNQGQEPNQPNQPNQPDAYGNYGGYTPPSQPSDPYSGYVPPVPPTQQASDPYSGQQSGYGQPQYGQPQGGYQQPGYQQGAYQPPFGAAAGVASPLGPTSMGMDPKVAAGLSYVLGWITGLVFFLVEKQNRFVRFHAMQSILFFGGLSVLGIVLGVVENLGIPVISLLALCVNGLIGLVGFVGWIVLLINGFQGKYFKLPVIGDYAERYANQGIPGIPGV